MTQRTRRTAGTQERVSRRRMFLLCGALLGLTTLDRALPERASAATGDTVVLGQDNQSGSPTRLNPAPDTAPSPMLQVTAGGPLGVLGQHPGSGEGVRGTSNGGVGVRGISAAGTGVVGQSDAGGDGVFGSSATGVGVRGVSSGPDAAGVRAAHLTGGLALEVEGKVRFGGIAGFASIPAGAMTHYVANTHADERSMIIVNLMGNPGGWDKGVAPVMLHWVERHDNEGFSVHLTAPALQDTPFSYLIVDP
jgi:hypothetical protein